MYGCRVIQKALEFIPPDQQVIVSFNFNFLLDVERFLLFGDMNCNLLLLLVLFVAGVLLVWFMVHLLCSLCMITKYVILLVGLPVISLFHWAANSIGSLLIPCSQMIQAGW